MAIAPDDPYASLKRDLIPDDFRSRAASAVKDINPRMPPRESVGRVAPQDPLMKALGLTISTDPATYYSGIGSTTWEPSAPIQEWRRQNAHETMISNLDWKGKLAYDVGQGMQEGPFATALETLLKPLTITVTGTRLLVENILRKRPKEGGMGWDDAWEKIGGIYTFGELLADFDVWQEEENLKWARMVGFAGDVALDPLTWLGLVGKAIGFGAKLAAGQARVISGAAIRNAIVTHVGDDASRVFGGVLRNTKLLDDDILRAVADDLVKGTDNFVTRVSDDVVQLDLGKVAGVTGPTNPLDSTLIMTLDNALIDDIQKMYAAGERAIRRGATAITDDEMRIAARHVAENQLDNALRSPTRAPTRAVDDLTGGKVRGYTKPWVTLDEVEDLTFAFGWRVPFTGRVGKAIFRHKLQQPIGIKFWGSNTKVPLIGTWVRGVPQAARTVFFGRKIIGKVGRFKGPLAKAAAMTGKATEERFGTGYGGLIGWMKRGGRAPEVRQLMREAMQKGDAASVHQYKAFLHAAGRGDMAARVVRQNLLRQVDAFFKEADVAGANTADLYHAIAGSGDAAARVGQELTDKGRLLMGALRETANEAAGQKFLGFSADYVPRILSEEGRNYLEAKGRGLVHKGHKGHAFQESGFEQTRKYISKEEFGLMVDQTIANGATPAEADALVRRAGHQHDFLGEDLYKAGSEMPSGEIAQDVEKQIADIMERLNIDYRLFDEDLRVALSTYVDAISKRVGDVFIETLMKREGIFFDATATFVHIPDLRMTDAVLTVRSTKTAMIRAEADLENKLRLATERWGKDSAEAADSVVEAEKILEVAEEAYTKAVDDHAVKAQEYLVLEQQAVEIEQKIIALETREKQLVSDMGEPNYVRLVDDEMERVAITKELNDLYKSEPMFVVTRNRLRAAAATLEVLEDKIYSVFADKETYEAFVKAFDTFADGTIDDYAMAALRDGKKGFNPIRSDAGGLSETAVAGPRGAVAWEQGSDVVGWEMRVGDRVIDSDEATEILANVESLVADMDSTGLADWLGLEMFVRAEGADGIASALNQINSIRQIVTGQVKDSVPLLEQSLKRIGADALVGNIPSPQNIGEAKALMRSKLNEAWEQTKRGDWGQDATVQDIWPTLMDDADFYDAAATYYGVHGDGYAVTSIPDGADLESMIEGARVSMKARAQALQAGLADAPAPAGGGVTSAQVSGLIHDNLTIADVADYLRIQNGIQNFRHGPQMPLAVDDISIHRLFAEGDVTDAWQRAEGMTFVEDTGSELGVKGGSNEGYKVKLVLADGTIKRFYVKKYVDVAGAYPSGPLADAARHRVSGEVLADRLYNEIATGSAPTSYYGIIDSGPPSGPGGVGVWKATAWQDDLVQGIHVPMANQFRELMDDGTYRIVQTYSPQADPYAIYKDVPPESFIPAEAIDPSRHTPMSALVGDQMTTDMFVGNLDVVGYAGDNIGIDKMTGEVFRLDNGSAFHYRAQGELKGTNYNYEELVELDSFFNQAHQDNQAMTIDMWIAFRSSFDDVEGGVGFASEVSNQAERILSVRSSNGGWEPWVRKQLPSAPDEDVHMFVDWLETRSRVLADRFQLPYHTGSDLIGENLARSGVPAAQIEEALTGTYGINQKTSEKLGYRSWLSPEINGVSESQALEVFTFATALDELGRNATNPLGQARDVEVVRHVLALHQSGRLQRMMMTQHPLDVNDSTLMNRMFRSEIDETTFEAAPQAADDVDDWLAGLSPKEQAEAKTIMAGQAEEALPPETVARPREPQTEQYLDEDLGEGFADLEGGASAISDMHVAQSIGEGGIDATSWSNPAATAPAVSPLRAADSLPQSASQVPWDAPAGNYGVVILDSNETIYLRMPTDEAGKPYGGNRWSHTKGQQNEVGGAYDENPMQTAVREAYEETGLRVELVGYLPQVPKSHASQTHYFVGRVKAGTATGETVLTGAADVQQSMMRLAHGSGHGGYFASQWGLGTSDPAWLDQTSINARIASILYDQTDNRFQHYFNVNLPHGSSSIKIYGLPARDRQRYASLLREQAALDANVATEFEEIKKIDAALDGMINVDKQRFREYEAAEQAGDFGLGDRSGKLGPPPPSPIFDHIMGFETSSTQLGQRDMLFDVYERARAADPDLWESLLAGWREGRVIDTGWQQGDSLSARQAAKVIDTVTALEARHVFPEGMTWRNKVTFIGWLNTPAAYAGNVKSALRYQSGGARHLLTHNTRAMLDVAARRRAMWESLDNLVSQPQSQLEGDVTLFLASISNDSSNVGSGFANRVAAEEGYIIEPLLSASGAADESGNLVARMGDYTNILEHQGGDARRAIFRAQESMGSGPVTLSPARAEGWAEAVLPTPTGGSGGLGMGTAMGAREFQELRAAVHTYGNFMQAYRRSLSMDGYTVSVWLNNEGINGAHFNLMNQPSGSSVVPKAPLANFMLTNPRALMPDNHIIGGPMSELERFAGQTGVQLGGADEAHSGFMHAEQFLREYEMLANAQMTPKPRNIDTAPDAMAQLQAAKADLILERGSGRALLTESKKQVDAARAQMNVIANQKAGVEQQIERSLNAMTLADDRITSAYQAQTQLELLQKRGADIRDDDLADVLRDVAIAVSHIHMSTVGQVDELVTTSLQSAAAQGTRNYRHLAELMDNVFGDVVGGPATRASGITSDVTDLGKDLQEGLKAMHRIRGQESGQFVTEDKFWFPLRDFPDREEILDQLWMSGYKAFGANAQGPQAMVEAMTAVTRFNSQGGWGSFLRHYDKVHNLLKGYMIAKPGFHMRNFFSATFMNYLHGVHFSSYRQFQRAYWKFQHDLAVEQGLPRRAASMKASMKKRGVWNNVNADDVAIVREMHEGNILGGSSGQVAAEFLQSPLEQGGLRRAWATVNPLNSRNAPLRLSRNVGVGTETYVRGVLGFDVLKHGNGTVDDAFDAITKWHFDYSDLSAFETKVVKRLVPFYTWTKHALPLMIEQVGKNPAKMSMYLKAKRNIEHGQEKAEIIPSFFKRQGAIQLPFKYKGENMFVLPDLPFKTPLELLDPVLAFDKDMSVTDRIQVMLGSVGTQVTPLIKAPYEWKAKQNIWKGYNFDGRYQQVPTAYRNIPLLMPMLKSLGLAEKENDVWLMRDYELHTMAQLLPTFTDMRRLFPSEERYQQRTLSTWMSFAFGMGLRTNTLDEQRRVVESAYWQQVEKMGDMRQLLQESQNENP